VCPLHASSFVSDSLMCAELDKQPRSQDGCYTGLVNVSGTYCFMNSTLQAFASLHSLLPYLNELHDKAEALDVPSPVTDALRNLLTGTS
jgi:ubiquitin C-terminal hydrolase